MTAPVANQPPTFVEFGNTPTPWLPDQPFWTQNAGALGEIQALCVEDYPHMAAAMDFDPTGMPTKEQRVEIWKFWYGRQHGKQDASRENGKVDITQEREGAYRRALGKIAIGNQPFMEAIPVNPDVQYDQALLNCGTQEENVTRLETADKENIKEIVALTGVRLRGPSTFPEVKSERTVESLFAVTGERTGTDMNELAAKSPFLQKELARPGGECAWNGPLPTEYHMLRLAVEAKFHDQIDWERYRETVTVQAPIGSNEETSYLDKYTEDGEVKETMITVPPREEGAVTYHLKDGRKVHVVNGAAVARPNSAPRANSESIANDAIHYVPIPENANVVAVCAVPHFRAAAQTILAYETKLPGRIARADIATSEMGPNTHLVAALGELIMMFKLDARLRALRRGQNPDAPELLDI
jgi:hypothetical protein